MYLMDLTEDIKEIRRLRYDYPRESISEEDRNSDGFITLEFSKKKKESDRYPDMPPLVPQLRRRKLKKSWERYFKSLIMKIVIPKYVKQFHNMKHECIYIKPDGNKITGIKKPRLSIGKLCERFDNSEDVIVLIPSGTNTYTKLSLASYHMLSTLSVVHLTYTLRVLYDGTDDYEELYTYPVTIYNIESLLQEIQYYRNLVHGIGELQAMVNNYDMMDIVFRIVIKFNDGTYCSYKDINDFMKDYELPYV